MPAGSFDLEGWTLTAVSFGAARIAMPSRIASAHEKKAQSGWNMFNHGNLQDSLARSTTK
jgi:hypothetical protein